MPIRKIKIYVIYVLEFSENYAFFQNRLLNFIEVSDNDLRFVCPECTCMFLGMLDFCKFFTCVENL